MSRFIKRVTVTGADDTSSFEDLRALHDEFPFVEFGILLSRRQMGAPRFPSAAWLREAVDGLGYRGMQVSGHICGSWVNEILMGKWPGEELAAIHSLLFEPSMFARFQLNTHAEPHEYDAEKLQAIVDARAANHQSIIIQNDGVNHGLLKLRGVQALFDLSHGAGILPDMWPTVLDGVECGYAGGLSPENVAHQISGIEATIGSDHRIWIDAETRLRTFGERDIFDIEKVRRFLQAAEPFTV